MPRWSGVYYVEATPEGGALGCNKCGKPVARLFQRPGEPYICASCFTGMTDSTVMRLLKPVPRPTGEQLALM